MIDGGVVLPFQGPEPWQPLCPVSAPEAEPLLEAADREGFEVTHFEGMYYVRGRGPE